MPGATISGFQDGFIEIVKEQLRVLQDELSSHDAEITRLEGALAEARRGRLEAAHRIEQLTELLSDSQQVNSGSSGLASRRPFADADAVVDLIREHGAPMHYEKIHEALVRRGFEIGGKGEANTLLSRYFRDPRLKRVSRGTYDLATSTSLGGASRRNLEPTVAPQDFNLDSTSIQKATPLVKKIGLVLRQAGEPLHYTEVTKRLLESGAWRTTGKTPEATVNSRLVVEINENGTGSTFTRTAPGVYGLREWDIVR